MSPVCARSLIVINHSTKKVSTAALQLETVSQIGNEYLSSRLTLLGYFEILQISVIFGGKQTDVQSKRIL